MIPESCVGRYQVVACIGLLELTSEALGGEDSERRKAIGKSGLSTFQKCRFDLGRNEHRSPRKIESYLCSIA